MVENGVQHPNTEAVKFKFLQGQRSQTFHRDHQLYETTQLTEKNKHKCMKTNIHHQWSGAIATVMGNSDT